MNWHISCVNSYMKLYIISNRLPVKVTKEDETLVFSRSEGGLATGLDSLQISYEKHWIGWPGICVDNEESKEEITFRLEGINFHPVFLSEIQIKNYYEGYNTALMISEEYPKGHPQVVQPAIQQARNLIRNLQRAETGLPLQPFIYQNKGSMATIGRNHAVVELKKLRFGGFPAWAVWLFIHLMSIVGVKNRLFIFVDWMWSYFTYDPSLRIIIKPLKRE